MGLVRSTAPTPATTERRAGGRSPQELREQLRSPDPEARRRATQDLWGDADAVPALLEAHAVETDLPAREAILTALAAHDTPQVGRALACDLRSEDPGLRNAAVKALQVMPAAVQAVVADGVLTDADADVRILAVMVLSAVEHPSVPDWLRPVVAADADARVVAAAVDVAVTLGADIAAELAPVAAARFPTDPYLDFLAGTVAP